MITSDFGPEADFPVHHDAVAAAMVTLKIEITDLGKLRTEAERKFVANEARIGHVPTPELVDSIFGTPERPDLEGCLNFMFPTSFPGVDIIDVDIKTTLVKQGSNDKPVI